MHPVKLGHWGSRGDSECRAGTEPEATEVCCLLACFLRPAQPWPTLHSPSPLSRADSAHSGLDPLIPIIDQGKKTPHRYAHRPIRWDSSSDPHPCMSRLSVEKLARQTCALCLVYFIQCDLKLLAEISLQPLFVHFLKKSFQFLFIFLSFFAFLRDFMYPRLSYVAECDLELLIFLPLPLKFWDQWCMPSYFLLFRQTFILLEEIAMWAVSQVPL